jgi:hypothetical protein
MEKNNMNKNIYFNYDNLKLKYSIHSVVENCMKYMCDYPNIFHSHYVDKKIINSDQKHIKYNYVNKNENKLSKNNGNINIINSYGKYEN